jgi:hypothetical protein
MTGPPTVRVPWWVTWLLGVGLVFVFVGERLLGSVGPSRILFTGLGVLLVAGSTIWRFLAWRSSSGGARSVEGLLLLLHGGCLAALGLYGLGGDPALDLLGIEFASPEAEERFRTVLLVSWCLLLALSLLPAAGAAWALGTRRAGEEAEEVEALRVREAAASGLTIAMVGASMLLIGWVAGDRDQIVDLSYFRTASPGPTTLEVAQSLEQPLEVTLFFPEVNAVKDELLTYFSALGEATGRVEIEEYDRMEVPNLAEELRVMEDGVVILRSGDVERRFNVAPELSVARATLRTLDEEVQTRLLNIVRGRRLVYLTSGHGELNDAESGGVTEGEREFGAEILGQILAILNYDVRQLGLGAGLAQDVPEDASAVFVLGPRRAFLEEEEAALARYLDRGGSLLLAVDPDTDVSFPELSERLGVTIRSVPLADDIQFVPRRNNASDHRLIVTDRASAHAALTTLSRAQMGAGILLMGSGYLEERTDSAGEVAPTPSGVRPAFILNTLPSTFNDIDRDFELDPGSELRFVRAVAAAVEVPADVEEGEGVGAGMRALVYADSDLFSDTVLGNIGMNRALLADAMLWLGHEEDLGGGTASEEDVRIQHTRGEDVAWFYTTIVGAPLLTLLAGLAGVALRRRQKGGEFT